MATYLRPGVYVQETLNAVPPSAGATSTTYGAFIGAINRGPLTPTLISRWSDFVNYYGNWAGDTTDTLRFAVRSFLVDNNGGTCVIQRVAGTGGATATATVYDSSGAGGTAGSTGTLTVSAANLGAWGNSISFDIVKTSATATTFNIVVYLNGVIVETWADLSMVKTNGRYAINIVNSGSIYITLADLNDSATAPTNVPASVTGQPLSSGADATGGQTHSDVAAAISSFDTVTNSLVLNAPGVTEATYVNALLTYAAGRNDVFVVIDPIADTVANQLTRSAAYTASSFGAVYYPQIVIADPTTTSPGVTRTINTGGAIVAQYLVTDKVVGPFKAPAGIKTRIGGAISVAPITNANLDLMNSAIAPVNAIRYISGSGIVIMGARTLQQTYDSRYVPVRRSLIYLEKSLNNLTQFAVFEPNDARLWRQLQATVGNFLTDYWRQGGLRGTSTTQAFYIICDSSNNTPTTIANGEVHIDVGVALQRPAEFVVIRIAQFDGGVTVTTA